MTTIERGPRATDRFAIISNDALADPALSYRARGILAYLLSRPPGWRTNAETLATQGREGREAVRTALKELEDAGYLVRERRRDEHGQWVHTSQVRDVPAGQPADGFPGTGEPSPVSWAVSTKTETKTETKTQPSSSEDADAPTDQASRVDVERLCTRLQAHIVSNGGRRPTITAAWRDAARLLLDRDGIPEDEATRVLDWSQADPFWQGNILSMPTFRKKFDQLRIKARASGAGSALSAKDRSAFSAEWADGSAAAGWEAVAGRPVR